MQAALAEDDAGGRIRWEGPLDPAKTLGRMKESAIHVLPSVNEPFGMTVIEAMTVGLPVVVLHDCGLAPTVLGAGGEVCGESVEELSDAIGALLRDSERRERSGANGRAYVRRNFGMREVASRLLRIYSDAIGGELP